MPSSPNSAAPDRRKMIADRRDTSHGEPAVSDRASPAGQVTVEKADLPTDTAPATYLTTERLQSFCLCGLLLFGTVAALYLAQVVILPIILAIVLKLLLQPTMRQAARLHIPRVIAALALTFLFVLAIGAIFTTLSSSASTWFSHLPQGLDRLEQKLQFLHGSTDLLHNLDSMMDRVLTGDAHATSTEATPSYHLSLPDSVLASTGVMLDISFSTVLLLFFLLAAGDTFLRKLVEILPRFRDKRQAVDICLQVERDIGYYLVTVTIMNLGVGFAVALGMYLCGLNDAPLWGVIAFVLNYVPILGPLFGVVLFVLVGSMSFDELWPGCLPAAIYLAIHVIEGEIVTPHLVARRLTLSPPLVIMSLIFWYWLWGVAGAFLAVPLLAITRIVCGRFPSLAAFGHFLGSSSERSEPS